MFHGRDECLASDEPWHGSPVAAPLLGGLAVLMVPVKRKLEDNLVVAPEDGACFLVDLMIRQEERCGESWSWEYLAVAG
jgi:hypothetical protein